MLSISQTSNPSLICLAPLLFHTTQLVVLLTVKHNQVQLVPLTLHWWLPWLESFEREVLKPWLKCSSLNVCILLLGSLWHEVQAPSFAFILGFQTVSACLGPLLRWRSSSNSPKPEPRRTLDVSNPFQCSLSRNSAVYLYQNSQKSIVEIS